MKCMFAIGQVETKVDRRKVTLPKEYHLRRRNRKIYGVWIGDRELYLSDELRPLQQKAGINSSTFVVTIDQENRIVVPAYLEDSKVSIQGCITTIELKCQK